MKHISAFVEIGQKECIEFYIDLFSDHYHSADLWLSLGLALQVLFSARRRRCMVVIIYHDFLPPPRTGNHVKSDYTHTHTHSHQDTLLSPYTWHLSLYFQWLRPCHSLSQPHHVTASQRSPCDNHQSTGGRSERTQCQKKWPRETHSVTYVPGLSSLSDLSPIVA